MKVVLIGLGSVGKKHINALLNLADFNFDIYALRNSKKSASVLPNVTNIFSLEKIDFEPDFFIVSNPTFCHFKTIQSLLAFGKPLLMEKPEVMNLEEGVALANAFFKQPVINYAACHLRFLDVLIFAKNFLEEKDFRINEVNIYAGSYMPDWRPHQNFKDTYSANTEMGGGIHLDSIHEIDYLYWFFGKPKTTRKILRNNSSLDISAVDYANYTFIYDTFVASVVLNYFRKDKKRSFEILTDKGTLAVNIETGIVRFNEKIIFFTEQRIADTYKVQMEYFINCIQTNTKPMNTFEEAFEVLKMCLNED